MTKTLRKSITHRSRLKYIGKRNDNNWENYKKQRNVCVDLLCKTKKYQKLKSQKYQASVSQNWHKMHFLLHFHVCCFSNNIGRYE